MRKKHVGLHFNKIHEIKLLFLYYRIYAGKIHFYSSGLITRAGINMLQAHYKLDPVDQEESRCFEKLVISLIQRV